MPSDNEPPCGFTANVGYTCPFTGTASTGGVIAAGMADLATLTDADITYDFDNVFGRYVSITGATSAANNGVFPILNLNPGDSHTINYINRARVAETIPATGSHVNLAGVGPIPGAPDVGFLRDTDDATFSLAPGGGNHLAMFRSTTLPGTVGDDFPLVAAEQAKLNAIPNTGAAFSITCDGPGVPPPCGTASGTVLDIVTTDASTAGLSPFAMPLPNTKRVEVRCAQLGTGTINVPAAYMASIMTSGATRIQATFMRPTLMTGGPATVNSLAGHATIGFTNRN